MLVKRESDEYVKGVAVIAGDSQRKKVKFHLKTKENNTAYYETQEKSVNKLI